MQRPRERNKVRTLTDSRPRSASTPGTWALQVVGSIKRARTICSKARSPPTASPSPRRVYTPCRTSHNRPERLEATTAPTLAGPEEAGGGADGTGDRSRASWSGAMRCRPISIRAASSAWVWAEPRCSMTLSRRPSLTAICTAIAPEAVLTLRRNGLTTPTLPAP